MEAIQNNEVQNLNLDLNNVVFNFGNNAKDSGYSDPVLIMPEQVEGKRDQVILNGPALELMEFNQEKNFISFLELKGQVYLFNTTSVKERKDRLNIGKNGAVTSKKIVGGLVTSLKLDRTKEHIFNVIKVTHDQVAAAYLEPYTVGSDSLEDGMKSDGASWDGQEAHGPVPTSPATAE